jgi:hypothetical protein
MELEFGAVAERLEPENLKPLQFEQRGLLKNSGQLSAASCQSMASFGFPTVPWQACLPTRFLSFVSMRALATFSPWAG